MQNPINTIQTNVNPTPLNQQPPVIHSHTSSPQKIDLPTSVNFTKAYEPTRIIQTSQ